MSEPKNQHIIPQCYLKQFVDPNVPIGHEPFVWIFEREKKVGRKKAPKNILAESDFYTLKTNIGGKDYTIEKSLSRIESEYSSIFEKKIKEKLSLNNYEHLVLCAFVAAMWQRTAKQKENINRLLEQVIGMTEEMEIAHGLSPKKSSELKSEKENTVKLSLANTIPHITEILLKMNLAFFCSNKASSFITSDSPCYLFNYRLQWQRFYGPGLMQKHIEVRMPLSPKISVCFSWANNLRGYLRASTDLVHESNRMIFSHSYKYFIANSSVIRRRWFRRFPLDPVFIIRIFKNRTWPRFKRIFKRRPKQYV